MTEPVHILTITVSSQDLDLLDHMQHELMKRLMEYPRLQFGLKMTRYVKE